MNSLKPHRLKRLVKDPFVLLIAIVVMVPALLVIYAVANQSNSQSAVNGVSQNSSTSQADQTSSSNSTEEATNPKPITDAEQPVPPQETPKPAELAVVPAPGCDQAKKQAAINARMAQRDQENRYHEDQTTLINRLTAVVSRKRWDEEKTRHNNVLSEIEATYGAALTAANC